MKIQNYQASITAPVSPREAFEKINRLPAWWGKDFTGRTEKLDDVFTIRFGETWVTFKVVDSILDEKMEWEIIDCHLPWLADQTEWKNTNLIWKLSAKAEATQIDFTHVGLIPEVECYDVCVNGWDFYIKESLFKLLSGGQGLPNGRGRCVESQTTLPVTACAPPAHPCSQAWSSDRCGRHARFPV